MRQCSLDFCEEPYRAGGFCHYHYHRNRRGMDLVPRPSKVPAWKKTCIFEGCKTKQYAKGLCYTHYMMQNRGEELRAKLAPQDKHSMRKPRVPRGECAACAEPHFSTSSIYCQPCHRRNYRLGRNFGITLLDFLDMEKQQSGKCAICDELCADLHVDHCHDTGVVRGLLCGSCNRGIGLLRDDPGILMNAVNYLST